MTYSEVVKKAKQELAKRGEHRAGGVELYACKLWENGDQINLWSYWQGYQIEDIDQGIDILLVGQDWGNPEWDKDVANRIEKIQNGEDASYCEKLLSPTDKNLIELFEELGCKITDRNPGKRILFTNYCLGYRKGKQTGGLKPKALALDKELFDDLVKAVHPKTIICLGKITYEAVTSEKVVDYVKHLKDGQPFISSYPGNSEIKVFGVPHCGARGSSNVGGINKMKEIWGKIAFVLSD